MRRAEPSYLQLHRRGELPDRVRSAYEVLSSCTLCPRCCGVDRCGGEKGFCRGEVLPRISSYGPHFGEEPPLVGRYGSGTIFFAHCTMRCEFCQNFEISHLGQGEETGCDELARMMIELERRGCHNINLVSPTHYVPQIIEAVAIAAGMGLSIPLVYNTGGYDRVQTLRLLDGIIDIYMPDAKYGEEEMAVALSHAPGYVEAMKSSILEMHRQAGDLSVVDGIAERGLIIRHLVLPEGMAGTEAVMAFIAGEVSRDSYVNIMDQYRPMGNVYRNDKLPPALRRPVTEEEYREAIRAARKHGLYRGFQYEV